MMNSVHWHRLPTMASFFSRRIESNLANMLVVANTCRFSSSRVFFNTFCQGLTCGAGRVCREVGVAEHRNKLYTSLAEKEQTVCKKFGLAKNIFATVLLQALQ